MSVPNEHADRLWDWFIETLHEVGYEPALTENQRTDMRYAICRTVEREQERTDEERDRPRREADAERKRDLESAP
jgi:hypothetical protein